ncbi:unnamed protein product [Dibothriocephalus latus]|uniref:Uncharacterized protein n=1 Tax=Dibothriocephalus latus TaxID=60516 RepID=A0A3P7LL72_DIBLA|nr:unnamed protein product [Dibothriocephalus latus]
MTLEKPIEEDLSDVNNNVGGSPPTDLPSSPTKDQTLSSADADAESRGISSASSPFAPSSAPLSTENGLGRCSLTTQDSGVDETLDETMEEERGRAKHKLCGEVPETEEADYAGWVIEEKANEVLALGSTTACAEPEASPSNLATRPTEDTTANVDISYPERRGTRLRRRRRRSRISQPLTGRDVESSKGTFKSAESCYSIKTELVLLTFSDLFNKFEYFQKCGKSDS